MDNILRQYDTISTSHYESILDISSKSYTEADLQSFDILFESLIGENIYKAIDIQDKYQSLGSKIVITSNVQEFLEKIFTASCPKILKYNSIIQQLYILHIYAICLHRFNNSSLKLEEEYFINNFYIPNVTKICTKFLPKSRKIIYKIIRDTYKYIENNSNDAIAHYISEYKLELSSIKNDIIYLFLKNILIKFDPIQMEDIEQLYFSIIYKMYFFYLKSRISSEDFNYLFVNSNILKEINNRYYIYEEAIYLTQIQTVCNNSVSFQQILEHYDKFKSITIFNEIQRLYLFGLNGGFNNHDNIQGMLLQTYDNTTDLSYIKKHLPQIYKLLRSIHIISDTITLNINVKQFKEDTYFTLYNKFKHTLSEETIQPVLTSITDNLTNSLLTGEFIDISTLTSVNISSFKFIDQFQKFLQLILNNVNLSV